MNLIRALLTRFGETDPRGMPDHLFFGARKMDYATAQRADISKQNYSVMPRHWYVDATFVCHECKKDFVFTAGEQQFWYEDRRFWIDSLPKRCAPCRKSDRNRLELRKRYDALVATALGTCPTETKKEVLDIINELDAAGEEIPERMETNRAALQSQVAKAAKK